MSSPGNARPSGLIQTPQKSTKKQRKLITFLLSCCLLLAVFSACLLGALVLVGKHYIYNNNGTEFIKSSRFRTSLENKIFRLPKDVRPIHYDITLRPNLKTGTFKGIVNITINITKPRRDIFIHNRALVIKTLNLSYDNNVVVPVLNVNDKKSEQVFQITLKKNAKPRIYYLFIEYSGHLGANKSKLSGFYRSSYENKNGTYR